MPKRDSVDARIIDEVSNGTATYGNGIINSQTDVGGWPVLNSLPAPPDFDHDGMPNDWELANGLDSSDATDRNIVGPDGYTNLEIYLNNKIEYPTSISAPTKEMVPNEFVLAQNYPNPFNPVTTIRYQLPKSSKITIIIYDIMGKRIRTLLDANQNTGQHSILWDAMNDQNYPVSSGVYFYQIQTDDLHQDKKMLLIR